MLIIYINFTGVFVGTLVMYDLYASDRHLPANLIDSIECPIFAAVDAAPILKEWALYFP